MQISAMRAIRILRYHRLRCRALSLDSTKQKLEHRPTISNLQTQSNIHFPCQFDHSDYRFIHTINHHSQGESSSLEVADQGCSSSSTSDKSEAKSNSTQNPKSWSFFHTAPDDKATKLATNEKEDKAIEEKEDNDNGIPPLQSDTKNQDLSKAGAMVFNKRKTKNRSSWLCSDCGNSYSQWWATCMACKKVGTIKAISVKDIVDDCKVNGIEVSENAIKGFWLPEHAVQDEPMRLTYVNRGINHAAWRIQLSGLFGAEVSRVLGGGVVPGSLILVGGDPGVGKSTLLLQIAAMMVERSAIGKPAPVVYVSGEESIEQIGNRADRMKIGTEELYLYSSTDIEDILEKIQPLSPCALVIDSIQTVYLKGVAGSPGGLSQIKECTAALLRFAKMTNVPVLLIGHVNKSGDIAGPRVLEHIVDVVLYMEGEKHSSYRLLRSVKNRFGSTDELGVFEMYQSGLQTVANPSEMFLSEQHFGSEHLAGLAVAVIIDGSRSFLIEVQALCLGGGGLPAAKHVNGIKASRADMIIAVLVKQAGIKLEGNVIFINVVSGVSLTETAGDLAVAVAICSSFLEIPVLSNVAFIGEIGLGGELRMVPRIEKRVITVAKLGYKMCVVPKFAEKSLAALDFGEMQLVGCKDLKEVISKVFVNN